MSLRKRLVLAMVALVTVGLVAASAATYGFLRASLLTRVDAQLRGSAAAGTRELFAPDRGPFARRGGSVTGGVTYAGLIDATGQVTAERTFGFVANDTPPDLTAELMTERVTDPRFVTTGARGSSLTYRVLLLPLRGGGAVALAIPLDDVNATLARLLAVEAIVTVAVLLAVVAMAMALVRVGLHPLREIEMTAQEIAAGDLTRRVEPTDTRTEIGRLGSALNVMLERIGSAFAQKEASEARLRRFVADASHELRTPLTSIRGYAELFRRGADRRPDDLADAMRRIESESERMGGLVDELLLLARLDQGRPLDREAVDLALIVADAVEDARVSDPARTIEISGVASAVFQGDEARLRQVIANVLTNSLVHTPSEAAIRVRVDAGVDDVTVEIADDGPGMSAEHVQRAFDRFFRVDPARTRDTGGTGLGLSIVSAIIQAHGGTISLTSEAGAGTQVTIRLPSNS